jgi:hypothetical protein
LSPGVHCRLDRQFEHAVSALGSMRYLCVELFGSTRFRLPQASLASLAHWTTGGVTRFPL